MIFYKGKKTAWTPIPIREPRPYGDCQICFDLPAAYIMHMECLQLFRHQNPSQTLPQTFQSIWHLANWTMPWPTLHHHLAEPYRWPGSSISQMLSPDASQDCSALLRRTFQLPREIQSMIKDYSLASNL
jgi:hypothetical protein